MLGFNVLDATQWIGDDDTDPVAVSVGLAVDVFTAVVPAQSWTRARAAITMAATALAQLSLVVPADLRPTLYQIPDWLQSAEFRDAAMPFLSVPVQRYYTDFDKKRSDGDFNSVEDVFQRLGAHPRVKAFLGQPVSTFDLRKYMDERRIVLIGTGGPTGETQQLVTAVILTALFRAFRSRENVPPDQRPPMWVVIDELRSIAGKGGGAAEALILMCVTGAKYGFRSLALLFQELMALYPEVADMILTNMHVFTTHQVSIKDAKPLADRWKGYVEPADIANLERFHWWGQATTADGRITVPHKARGFNPTEFYRDRWTPGNWEQMNAEMDARLGRRPVREVLEQLDHLTDDLTGWLQGQARADAKSGTTRRVFS